MNDQQVQHLAMRAAAGERVCARVTRRANGNLVLLEPERNRPRFAGALLSTLLITGGAAAQNLQGEQTVVAQAVLSGTLLRPDGSPFDGGRVLLRTGDSAPVTFPVGMDGHFEATVTPGVYDLALRGNALFGARVKGVTLHEGEQSVGPVKAQLLIGTWDRHSRRWAR